ncbi:uncharacterized protein PGTG_10119 [Puccinia graminis f. sp. tritici CRL 75-36-700-3]|uniref:Uncharacterized protein n=1 Tax=Puccinia graminis f. sp. tritici (strain CRL 75-36-700-3 / race SCCL) TaxID=418459 RepID=E3KJC4_PUCGT|nr:uncharacterized protein PGTG_10119 [Puccinia graminis f. sp. tritici CRL 75-36-700-3]EFP84399.1 hypothetical protein PGTG_10119 [Puccinia graminis f. sp. tritici CRL 75-36-700-3]
MAPTRSSKSQPSNLRSRNTRSTRNITQNTKDRQAVNPRAPKKRSNRHRVEESDNEEDEQEHSSPPNTQVEITLENFHSQLQNWSIYQLRQTLQKKKESNSNRLPPNIQDTISLLQQNYIKSKLMLALIGNLVNHQKVRLINTKGPDSSNKSGEVSKQAYKSFQKLNRELYTSSTLYNTTYYLLAATRSPGENSFCREWSNDVAWLTLAKDKWKAKESFEAYSHGCAIQEEVEEALGVEIVKKQKDSDLVKIDLRAALNKALALARGVPAGSRKFPKTKDPAAALIKINPRLRILQSEDSLLHKDMLAKCQPLGN